LEEKVERLILPQEAELAPEAVQTTPQEIDAA
jgi:hypothetical protein